MPKKYLFPVIHVLNLEQAAENCQVAIDSGCDGAFLINHESETGIREITFFELLIIHQQMANLFPDFWLGVNCLDLPAAEVFQHLSSNVAGVWVDNAEVDERLEHQLAAENILTAKAQSRWSGLYFGGVAFKYQRPVVYSGLAAAIAKNYVDVVTTSGAATGESASVEKIRDMKQAIAPTPLAIASGITAANVPDYLPWVDYFLVATGISRDFYTLDSQKTKQLAQIIHNF